MTDIYEIIKKYRGNEPREPHQVEDDYKEFKDYTYNVKMSLKDINYLLDLLNAYGDLANGAYCAKARFWKILLDSGVNVEVKEKTEQRTYPDENGNLKKIDWTTERMFARPPFGCVKNRDKSGCELSKSKGCDICEFNCLEELELSGKSTYANPNFVGFAKQVCPDIPLTDIAISNIKNNDWDCLWLADSCKLWPLEKEDKVYA